MNDLKADQLNIHHQFGLLKSSRVALSELSYQAEMTLYRL